MILYYSPQTRAFPVLWTLEELAVEYELKIVNLKQAEQKKDEYRLKSDDEGAGPYRRRRRGHGDRRSPPISSGEKFATVLAPATGRRHTSDVHSVALLRRLEL